MRNSPLLPALFLILPFYCHTQNYLRVADPDWWGAPSSNLPGWYADYEHGKFEELTLVATPQGIFTEIEVFATITHSPDAWAWGDFEIIWQFDLPQNSIVHDAWLWVGPDIIKADVIDFWTALETYTGIVDYNEDPLFMYQLSDKRYEVRIFPLPPGGARRLKLSFLVPAVWDANAVSQQILQNMVQSTDYPPSSVAIAVPVNSLWGTPTLRAGGSDFPMTNLVTGGSGDLLHHIEISGAEFVGANELSLVFDPPFTEGSAFASTYSDAGDNYYQLVYLPDWEGTIQSENAQNALILLDYDSSKSSLSKELLLENLQNILEAHFSHYDAVNVAVSTSNGTRFLSGNWWNFNDVAFPDTLAALLGYMDNADLESLLMEGFNWSQTQGNVDGIYLLAANEDYVYPTIADDVFYNIAPSIPNGVPFTLLDYHDKNVSVIFYGGQKYHGNEYFYLLLENNIAQFDKIVLRETSEEFSAVCSQIFPAFVLPSGMSDFNTSLENGVNFQEYNIGDAHVAPGNPGVIMQTGKYYGTFPMNIQAELIADDGQFWTFSETISFANAVPGDTLMREIWYGPHLKNLEALLASDADRLTLIEKSKTERVLTGLTAFLALEPNLGGEPCIDCLFNNGDIGIIATSERFDPSKAELLVTPNPATDVATIYLVYDEILNPNEWTASIHDLTGRLVSELGNPSNNNGKLSWKWEVEGALTGLYFVRVKSEHGELTGKIVVAR